MNQLIEKMTDDMQLRGFSPKTIYAYTSTFKWWDYRDKSKQKLMTIDGHEFLRRFLMHVLPYRFVKIRHFGILSNRNRQGKLLKCKKLTGVNLFLFQRSLLQ